MVRVRALLAMEDGLSSDVVSLVLLLQKDISVKT